MCIIPVGILSDATQDNGESTGFKYSDAKENSEHLALIKMVKSYHIPFEEMRRE